MPGDKQKQIFNYLPFRRVDHLGRVYDHIDLLPYFTTIFAFEIIKINITRVAYRSKITIQMNKRNDMREISVCDKTGTQKENKKLFWRTCRVKGPTRFLKTHEKDN